MGLISHGVPVTSARQYSSGLSPGAGGTGWNFITQSWVSPNPVEWVVIKDLTGTPTVSINQVASHTYANNQIGLGTSRGQMRAPNGRIFWACYGNYIAYYDPTSESVSLLGPFTESPAIDPNASTIPYSGCFDSASVSGNPCVYFATQESQERPSCVVKVDTVTLDITVLGYVGSGALAYTTYGYNIYADTGSGATTPYLYVVYGESPWQLWSLKISDGTATKLAEVTSTGRITLSAVSGQGWLATIHTDLGQPDDVVTTEWCQEGALSTYSVGNPSPAPRDVTSAYTALTTPPDIDYSRGIGQVGWRANGSSGAYSYVDYSVNYTAPITIEMLVTTPDGVMGNTEQYNGSFRHVSTSDSTTWFGAQSGVAQIAQPLALYVASLGKVFMAGYPDGDLLEYDPTATWNTYPTAVNPSNPGYFGPSGTLDAGIKYAGNPITPSTHGALGNLVWSPSAGSAGRLYCAGTRDRTGTGAGIGYWDESANTIAGTYASPLTGDQPQGLVAMESLGYIVMATNTLSGSGDAPLYVFDHDLTLVATYTPLTGKSDIGQIVPMLDGNSICGIVQGSGSSLGLWQFNVSTGTLIQYIEAPITGTLGTGTLRSSDNTYWTTVGSSLVRVEPNTLTATLVADLTSIGTVTAMAFAPDGVNLFMAAGSDNSGSQLWSLNVNGSTKTGFLSKSGFGVGTSFLRRGSGIFG